MFSLAHTPMMEVSGSALVAFRIRFGGREFFANSVSLMWHLLSITTYTAFEDRSSSVRLPRSILSSI